MDENGTNVLQEQIKNLREVMEKGFADLKEAVQGNKIDLYNHIQDTKISLKDVQTELQELQIAKAKAENTYRIYLGLIGGMSGAAHVLQYVLSQAVHK